MPPRRAVLHGSLAAAVALLAGCTSDDTGPPADSPTARTPEPSPASQPTVSESPSQTDSSGATPTEIGRTTSREPVGTGRNPADVVLSNGDDRSHEVRVAVRKRGAEAAHYDQSVTLDPEGRYRMDPLSDGASGTHILQFRLPDGTARQYEWDLDEQSEDGWLSVGVTGGAEFVVQYAMA